MSNRFFYNPNNTPSVILESLFTNNHLTTCDAKRHAQCVKAGECIAYKSSFNFVSGEVPFLAAAGGGMNPDY